MAGFLCLLAGFLQRLIAMSYRGGENELFFPRPAFSHAIRRPPHGRRTAHFTFGITRRNGSVSGVIPAARPATFLKIPG